LVRGMSFPRYVESCRFKQYKVYSKIPECALLAHRCGHVRCWHTAVDMHSLPLIN
jgi:hypothetical protein